MSNKVLENAVYAMTEAKRRQALAEITVKTDAARALIKEAEAIANKSGVEFEFSLTYGMGGTYHPPRKQQNWDSSSSCAEGSMEDSEGGWQSSSSNC
jgi:hypothetical protein